MSEPENAFVTCDDQLEREYRGTHFLPRSVSFRFLLQKMFSAYYRLLQKSNEKINELRYYIEERGTLQRRTYEPFVGLFRMKVLS